VTDIRKVLSKHILPEHPVKLCSKEAVLLGRPDIFTGFIVIYDNGARVYEKENYFSKKLNKKCATNWAEIDKSKISSIELHWKGELKAFIDKAPSDSHKNELNANDWFFSHRGYLDMGTRKVNVIARNIGFIEDGMVHIITVIETSGETSRSVRVAQV